MLENSYLLTLVLKKARVFITVSHFHASILFVGKAGAFPKAPLHALHFLRA
jgi:hypothetical protein